MKQQKSALIAPFKGQIAAHLTPIDYQSQNAQASAQIVRKNKYAAITLSSRYAYHPKHKKSVRTKPRASGIFYSQVYPFYTLALRYSISVIPAILNRDGQRKTPNDMITSIITL